MIGFLLVAVLSGVFNLWFVFLPSHLAITMGIDLTVAPAAGLGGLLVAAVVAPLAGRWSDRVGRRPVLLVGLGALSLLPVPASGLALTFGLASALMEVPRR